MLKTEALMTKNTNIMFPIAMKDTTDMIVNRRNKHEQKQTFILSVMFGASNQCLDSVISFKNKDCAQSIWLGWNYIDKPEFKPQKVHA